MKILCGSMKSHVAANALSKVANTPELSPP